MTNRPEEPDSWDVIDNLDIEAEQQSFLLIAAVALSFLESYERNSKPVRIPKWEHQRIDWNEHVTKLLHENRFHREYRMSLEAFNQLLELLRPSITSFVDEKFCRGLSVFMTQTCWKSGPKHGESLSEMIRQI